MEYHPFVIRVYGLLVNDRHEVLLSDEYQLNTYMTKFPGGGLKYGEGPVDGLKREAMEELGQEIEVLGHFYTTDYFQQALFYEDKQLISIYYRVALKGTPRFRISEIPFDFKAKINGSQSFRWEGIQKLQPGDVTFPIDKKVVELLKKACVT